MPKYYPFNGSTKVMERGILKDREILEIQKFIQNNYDEMYATWRTMSSNGFYRSE